MCSASQSQLCLVHAYLARQLQHTRKTPGWVSAEWYPHPASPRNCDFRSIVPSSQPTVSSSDPQDGSLRHLLLPSCVKKVAFYLSHSTLPSYTFACKSHSRCAGLLAMTYFPNGWIASSSHSVPLLLPHDLT